MNVVLVGAPDTINVRCIRPWETPAIFTGRPTQVFVETETVTVTVLPV